MWGVSAELYIAVTQASTGRGHDDITPKSVLDVGRNGVGVPNGPAVGEGIRPPVPCPCPPLAVGGATQCVLPPHLGVAGRGAREEVIGRLAPQGGTSSLDAAIPFPFEEGPGMIMHQHVPIEIACYRGREGGRIIQSG